MEVYKGYSNSISDRHSPEFLITFVDDHITYIDWEGYTVDPESLSEDEKNRYLVNFKAYKVENILWSIAMMKGVYP